MADPDDRKLRLVSHLTKEQLRSLFHQEKDVRRRERLHALWLGCDDPDWKAVARILDRNYETVLGWVKAYNAGGLEALGLKPKPGRPPKLSESQRATLAEAVRDGPTNCANWTAKGLVSWIRERFAVLFSPSWTCRLLHALGFSYRKPDHRYVHANSADRARFLEAFVRTVAEMGPRDVLVLADEASVDEHPTLHRAWMPCGEPFAVPTSGKHRKRHVFGIVNPRTGFSLCRITKRLRAVHFVALLRKLLGAYPGRRILLVLDNGPSHIANCVRDFLVRHRRLVPVWLPKYSSDLNPIEELWKVLRHRVTHNRFFAEMERCGTALQAFFRDLPREVVKSVCGLDYLIHGR